MSWKLIRSDVVKQALRDLDEFVGTTDVSNHAAMIAAHPNLVRSNQYHAWVGRFLSSECDDVQLIPGRRKNNAELWRNLLSGGSAPKPPADCPDESAANGGDVLGPQSASDQPFTARMRLHQSWYRAHVLRLPCGTGPDEKSTKPYGNMLRREDGAHGLNFITPQIFQAAERRLAQDTGVVEPFRLRHNMLSSQPLCFNLFAPLAADLELAAQLLRELPNLSVRNVLRVELEFTPGTSGEYLNDGTAFDAYIEYEQTDGQRAFLGVEVKLTEPFSQKEYDSPSYRRWMTGARSPWRPEAAQRTAKLQHNQLWRDHLLVVAHRDVPGSPYANGRLMLVRHPLDRSCERNVQAYSQLLRDGDDTLIDMPLDTLLARWSTAVSTESHRSWLAALHERYLDLEKSQQLLAASQIDAASV